LGAQGLKCAVRKKGKKGEKKEEEGRTRNARQEKEIEDLDAKHRVQM